MTLRSFLLGISSPKISVSYGASPDFLCVRFAFLGVAISFLLHRHWPDTLEVLRLISLQVSCSTSSPTSCEFLTFDMSCVTRLAGARQLDGRVRPHWQAVRLLLPMNHRR